MGALDTLRREHALILRALRLCNAMAERLHQGAPPVPTDVETLVDFFRRFADNTHNRKEEFLLTPWLHRHGFPTAFGPAACLRLEHDRTRRLLLDLEEASRRGPAGAGRLIQHLEQLEVALADHVHEEDRVLEEIARTVGAEEKAELDRAFEEAVPDQVALEEEVDATLRALEARFGDEGERPDSSPPGVYTSPTSNR